MPKYSRDLPKGVKANNPMDRETQDLQVAHRARQRRANMGDTKPAPRGFSAKGRTKQMNKPRGKK